MPGTEGIFTVFSQNVLVIPSFSRYTLIWLIVFARKAAYPLALAGGISPPT